MYPMAWTIQEKGLLVRKVASSPFIYLINIMKYYIGWRGIVQYLFSRHMYNYIITTKKGIDNSNIRNEPVA